MSHRAQLPLFLWSYELLRAQGHAVLSPLLATNTCIFYTSTCLGCLASAWDGRQGEEKGGTAQGLRLGKERGWGDVHVHAHELPADLRAPPYAA